MRRWMLTLPLVGLLATPAQAAGTLTIAQAQDPNNWDPIATFLIAWGSISGNFFDLWISDSANAEKAADLEPVPADMVMASGSGLDPHITQRNALCVYQLDRIAATRTPVGGDTEKVKAAIADLVRSKAFTPLSGFVGEPLVNVLEVNLELDAKLLVSAKTR